MKNTSVFESSILELPRLNHGSGNITPVNSQIEVPFELKRTYFLYDVPGGESRGGHAHKELQQLIVAASGSFDITLNDGKIRRTFSLSKPYMGLLMPPGLWRELDNFSSGAICLVLASHEYSEEDYIRNYNEFLMYKGIIR